MRNKKKFVFLPALFLLLSGCKGGGLSQTNSQSVKETPSEQVVSEKPKASKTSTGSKNDTSRAGSASISTSTSTSTEQKTLWNKEAKERRKKYFDGFYIPYVNIGKSYYVEWKDSSSKSSTYRTITGDEFDATKMDGFKTTYTEAGWNQTKNTNTDIIFEKDAFKVEITKDSDGYFLIKAYYNVVFDASKASGTWDDDTQETLNSTFPNFSIPYIYLGAPVCYSTYSSYSHSRTLYGYTFDASIITTAKATFSSLDGWTIQESTNSYGPVLKVTKINASTGETLTITIATPSSTSSSRFSIQLAWSENWDKNLCKDWDSALKQEFSADCDGHVPTYFYLGTRYPTYSYLDSSYKFTITGGVNDARTIPNIKETLENDTAMHWTVTRNDGTLEAKTEFDDGCRFIVRVSEPTSATVKTTATIFYVPKMTIPTTEMDWPKEIKQERTAQFAQTIPYIYLGDTSLDYTFDNQYARRKINTTNTGTFVSANIIYNAKKVLESDGWTVTRSSGYYGDNRTASKTFDNGDKMGITLSGTYNTSKAYLYIQRYEAYDSSYQGAWDTDRGSSNLTGKDTTSTGYSMNEHFGGHAFPYVYLGTKRHNSSWDATTTTRTVYGGQWNEGIIAKAKEVFAADTKAAAGDSDWTVTTNNDDDLAKATTLTATKTFEDGCAFTAKITKPSTGSGISPVNVTKRTITYRTQWGAKKTDWSDKVKEKILAAGFPSTSLIPYVYLGTDDATATNSTSYGSGYVQIQGTTFDDRVLTEFDNAFTAAGWTLSTEKKVRFGKESHEAYKYIYDDTGKVTAIRRAGINRWANTDNAKVSMRVFYDDASKASTATATPWTDEQKELRKKHLGGNDEAILPALNRGTAVTASYSTSGGGYLDLKTKGSFAYSYFNRENIKKTLDGEGWTTFMPVFSATSDPNGLTSVTATKTTSQGTIKLEIIGFYSSVEIKAYFHETFAAPSSKDAKWNADTRTLRINSRNGYELPYFYIGSKEPALTKKTVSATANEVFQLTGSTWDDSIITNRQTALKADTTITDWSFFNDYSARAKYGVVTIASGTHTVTVPAVYGEDGTTVITPEKTETHYVTLRLYKDTAANGNRAILEVYYY